MRVERSELRARSRTLQIDQLRLLPDVSRRVETRRREALHLCVVELGLRRERSAGRSRRSPAPGADGLLEVQGPLRAARASRTKRRLYRDGTAPGDGVRRITAHALRSLGQHHDQPCDREQEDHGLRWQAAPAEHAHRRRHRSLRAIAARTGRAHRGKDLQRGLSEPYDRRYRADRTRRGVSRSPRNWGTGRVTRSKTPCATSARGIAPAGSPVRSTIRVTSTCGR